MREGNNESGIKIGVGKWSKSELQLKKGIYIYY